jgi:uncharacterized protein with ParB-like and HNH nuclease domain
MANELESGMVPLTRLFSQDFFFRIPEYQRPFLWDEDDFSNLIDDLMAAPREESYFLGTLVLHKSGESQYDVIDGQQRLTALCILLACMRDAPGLVDDPKFIRALHEKVVQPESILDGIEEENRLQVRDQSVFNQLIRIKGSAASQLQTSSKPSPGERRYEMARSIFWEKIRSMNQEEIQGFAKFVTQQCQLIYLSTDSFDRAFHLFTLVNDRGKQLRRIDVLKADNLAPKYVSNPHSRTKYANDWEEMENLLGEKSFEEIFHLLRLIYIKDKPQSDLHSEFSKRIFGSEGTPKPGSEFMDELSRYVTLYNSVFLDLDFLDGQDSKEIHVEYHTLMEAMTIYFNASEWKACILFYARKFGQGGLYDFLLRIEKVYLDHWVRGVRKDERYSRYTAILQQIDSSRSSSEFLLRLGEIDLTAVREACGSENFYNANHSKYLLVRAEIVASEMDSPRHFQVRSVEHVLPQNPGPESEWSKTFSSMDHDQLVNSAGNLVLLSKSRNSRAGRKEFAAKKETYLEPRVSDFPRSMQVLGYERWTPEIVRARTGEFVEAVLKDPRTS